MKARHFNPALFLPVLCLALFYVLTVESTPAHAAGITLQADPNDTPLVISGTLNATTTTFSGSIRITATGGNVSGLILLASDLRVTNTATSTNPATVIDRSNISIPATDLTDGQPKDVRVTVSNVPQPDDYSGALKFLIPGQNVATALNVPLVLHIGITPDVVPALGTNTTVSMQVVHDQFFLDDFLGGLIMSGSYQQSVWNIQLDNQTPAAVTVTGVTIVMHGTNNNVVLSSTQAQIFCSLTPKSVPPPCTLPVNQVTSLQLKLNRDMLLPDDYQGTLRFSLANTTTPATVTVDLKVRGGPFWPFLVILAGVAIGFIAQSMTTALALKQLHLYPIYNSLKDRAKDIRDKGAQKDVLGKLTDALTQINSADPKATEDAVSATLTTIDHRISVYLDLDRLYGAISGSRLSSDVIQGLQQQVRNARTELETTDIQGDSSDVDKAVSAIQMAFKTDLQNAASLIHDKVAASNSSDSTFTVDAFLVARGKAFVDLVSSPTLDESQKTDLLSLKRSQTEIDALVPQIHSHLKKMHPKSRRQKQSWWQRLFGNEDELQGASFRYKIVRPLLGFLLVAILVLIGLQTLYVSNGATFGSAGITDYLGLLLWGISAKVAQSTLQNLPALQGAAAAAAGS